VFTGLVEEVGVVRRRERRRGTLRMRFDTKLGPLTLGESINVQGACLTVDGIVPGGFEADLSSETLSRSTLGEVGLGERVHLERATPLGGRMGGHVVLGHVDGIGRVISCTREGDTIRMEVRAPADLARYLAPKGSIAIDGVSLTVNGVADEGPARARGHDQPGEKPRRSAKAPPAQGGPAVRFDVMLVPHTLGRTSLGDLAPGDAVNLEVDVLARYVQRHLELGSATSAGAAPAGGDGGHDADASLYAKLRAGGFA
jgi:riboflavin synthase